MGTVIQEARLLLAKETAPETPRANRSRPAFPADEDIIFTPSKAAADATGKACYARLRDLYGLHVKTDHRSAYKGVHELENSIKNIGTLGPKFSNLSLSATMHSVALSEEKTRLSDTLSLTMTGDGAAKVELSRLPQLLKAVEICLLALLAVGSVPTPDEGFGSKGEDGYMFSADGEKQRWYFTLDTQLIVRVWVYDLIASAPLALFLPTWTALAGRASDLMLCDINPASALVIACRALSPFYRLPIAASVPTPKTDRIAEETKELTRLRSDLKGVRGELDQARINNKRARDTPSKRTPYHGNGSNNDRGSNYDKNITSPTGTRLCGDFQRGSCTRAVCVFAHECRRCGATSHGAETCPKR